MRIQDSAIFQEHPGAQEALKRERKYHNRERWLLCLVVPSVVLFLGAFFMKGLPELSVYALSTSIFGFTGACYSLLAGSFYNGKRKGVFREIETKISQLAGALGMTVEVLCTWPVKDIVFTGETTMVKLAGDILDFEVHTKAVVRIEGASAYLSNITYDFWNEHKNGMKVPVNDLHKALRAFDLTPPDYKWAFNEAERLRQQNPPSKG